MNKGDIMSYILFKNIKDIEEFMTDDRYDGEKWNE